MNINDRQMSQTSGDLKKRHLNENNETLCLIIFIQTCTKGLNSSLLFITL